MRKFFKFILIFVMAFALGFYCGFNVAEGLNECRLALDSQVMPIIELFNSVPLYITHIEKISSYIPIASVSPDRKLEVWCFYLESLITQAMLRSELTPQAALEANGLLVNMWKALYLQAYNPYDLPFDGEDFMKSSLRIFELLNKKFGWHPV